MCECDFVCRLRSFMVNRSTGQSIETDRRFHRHSCAVMNRGRRTDTRLYPRGRSVTLSPLWFRSEDGDWGVLGTSKSDVYLL